MGPRPSTTRTSRSQAIRPAPVTTGAGLVFYAEDTHVSFNNCAITDHDGKIGAASGADLTFTRCHFARAVMGPEIGSTALILEDTFITEMFGTDDNDGIYIHGQRAGQGVELRRCVVADGDDDGVDTLGSSVLIEDCIIRDVYDKGVSVNAGGPVLINNCLIVKNGTGVASKSKSGNPHVYIDNTTIVSTDTGRDDSNIGIHAYFKYATSGVIEYFVTNSIILAANPVVSDFGDHRLFQRRRALVRRRQYQRRSLLRRPGKRRLPPEIARRQV